MGSGDSFLAGEQRQMKTRTHGESDVSSDHDSDPSGDDNSSGGEGSASSPTDDGSSEEVIAMSQRTKHVHKKKRSKIKRKDSGVEDVPDKLLHSGVWPWLAQACETLEDVENPSTKRDCRLRCSSGFLTSTLSSCCSSSLG